MIQLKHFFENLFLFSSRFMKRTKTFLSPRAYFFHVYLPIALFRKLHVSEMENCITLNYKKSTAERKSKSTIFQKVQNFVFFWTTTWILQNKEKGNFPVECLNFLRFCHIIDVF